MNHMTSYSPARGLRLTFQRGLRCAPVPVSVPCGRPGSARWTYL
jgi:hypothetical protein